MNFTIKKTLFLLTLFLAFPAAAGWKDGLISFDPYKEQYEEKCVKSFANEGKPNMQEYCRLLVADTPGNYKSLRGKKDYKACRKLHKKAPEALQACFADKQKAFYEGFIAVVFNS